MKKNNKKALYESIMASVAKEVKKVLNEEEQNNSNANSKYAEDCKKLMDLIQKNAEQNSAFLSASIKYFTDKKNAIVWIHILENLIMNSRKLYLDIMKLMADNDDIKNNIKTSN